MSVANPSLIQQKATLDIIAVSDTHRGPAIIDLHFDPTIAATNCQTLFGQDFGGVVQVLDPAMLVGPRLSAISTQNHHLSGQGEPGDGSTWRLNRSMSQDEARKNERWNVRLERRKQSKS